MIAFTYMARLVVLARERTREYANLSWGVLSGLIRTLDARDHRAARHCAAVAASRATSPSSRDVAREQELAHTAGLLHDIGRFALSDRVMERGVMLTDDDWRGSAATPRSAPSCCATSASTVRSPRSSAPTTSGSTAAATRAGCPATRSRRSRKIIAVAEVYDTLTAPDTYRTPMTSFEALTELRRVAGKQLDADYVEALAELLAGRGTEYRHADEADFDRELDIERRMNEAVAR